MGRRVYMSPIVQGGKSGAVGFFVFVGGELEDQLMTLGTSVRFSTKA